jgi:hypothetical protein
MSKLATSPVMWFDVQPGLGLPAIVGTGDTTQIHHDEQQVAGAEAKRRSRLMQLHRVACAQACNALR